MKKEINLFFQETLLSLYLFGTKTNYLKKIEKCSFFKKTRTVFNI